MANRHIGYVCRLGDFLIGSCPSVYNNLSLSKRIGSNSDLWSSLSYNTVGATCGRPVIVVKRQ